MPGHKVEHFFKWYVHSDNHQYLICDEKKNQTLTRDEMKQNLKKKTDRKKVRAWHEKNVCCLGSFH